MYHVHVSIFSDFFFHHPSSQTKPILVHHPPTKKPRPSMWLISGARRPPPLRRHAVPSAERDQNWWKRTENEDIMRIWWLFHVEIYGDILQYFWFDMICNGTSMYPLVLQRTDYRSIQISTCSGLVSALYTMLWGGIQVCRLWWTVWLTEKPSNDIPLKRPSLNCIW